MIIYQVVGVSTFGGVIEAPAGMNKVPSLYMNQSNLPSASDYHVCLLTFIAQEEDILLTQ